MREKIVPTRGTMSAQRPGTSLGPATRDGLRSFVFHPGGLGYDYLTQLPTGERELMFGGGWASAFDVALADFGLADDSGYSVLVASHLAGALPFYFGSERWGREKAPESGDEDGEVMGEGTSGEGERVRWPEGRTKATWGGIIGVSADGFPWVGRLPPKIAGRRAPLPRSASTLAPRDSEKHQHPLAAAKDNNASAARLAAPGEWISAGYSGEGMVHAWLCGKALAYMLSDAEDELAGWFPRMLCVTEERWKKAKLEEFLERKIG